MPANPVKIAERLWYMADQLRGRIPPREYIEVLGGLLFLKFAYETFKKADLEIQETVIPDEHPTEPEPEIYKTRGAIYLPQEARYPFLLRLNTDDDIAGALKNALEKVEEYNPETLSGVLPKNSYACLNKTVLLNLLHGFDDIDLILDNQEDTFGRVYEYFLSKFALSEGHRGGEFFTPKSLVRLIVEIIEPSHGRIFDPACGSGGMLVQSAYFAREHEGGFRQRISIFGQERNSETVRFCKMNLTMHNLVGEIQIANSYYEDPYNAAKRFDYILANPPFNVRGIDIARLAPGRFPLGIPRGDNGNYLWINLFHNALNETGRAGFIMPNSASDARDSKREVRQRLIETGTVDVMIAISPQFHYNVTLPCTLWFLDEGKRKNKRRNQVLFIDARYIYHQVDRAHRAFQLEDIEFIADIVRLYRGESPETHHSSEHRLKEVFPDRVYADVPGLCTIATLDEIARQDWSLNVGRYVKVNENRIPAKLPISLERQTVFICYSRKDQKYLEMLRLHLTPLKRSNDVEIWADTDIAAGENWREKIKEVISRAGVTVLLISPAFLASKYIDEDELPPLLDAASTRGTKIIPILLSPCLYTSSQLANFQLANERPLLAMSQYQKDATLVKVAQRVEDILRNIAK